MAQGKRTPRDVEAEFRAHYIRTGNALESARRCKLKKGVAESLAKKANADPVFRKARDELLARGHEKANLAVLEALDIVLDALRAGPLEDSSGSPIDRRAELARAATGIFDSLDRKKARDEDREAARQEAAKGAERPERLVIVRYSDMKREQQAEGSGPADPAERPPG